MKLLIKREDLNNSLVSGNKWWKLKYNLEAALLLPHKTILTFGGAYSNHIYACAAAAREVGLTAVGIIRGEETSLLNPTLVFARNQGMKLLHVSRTAYRLKSSTEFIEKLSQQFGEFFLIPEGGSNLLAVKGCDEFARAHLSGIAFDYLMLPVGTGGTMTGIICGFEGKRNIWGVSVLKGGEFLKEDVSRMARDYSGTDFGKWSILTGYHEGGYAKSTPRLQNLIQEMRFDYRLPLDHVYTGKLLLATFNEIERGSFERGSVILVLHTGGLQAVSGSSPVVPNTTP